MPAAIFVTDSDSLFTLVMAANTAHLNGKERERYLVKTAIIGCDPYLLPPTVFCLLNSAKCLPQLTFPDIYIYLVHNPSPFTGESLKAFKSTDAYQYAVAGWVNDTKIWHVEKTHLHVITSKVNHSQALNSNPTSPWIVVQEDGTVVMAHCTCMAGLGEVCSHAAALMFTVVAAVEKRENQTCTEKPCTWTQPSTKMVKYNEVSNIFAIKEQVETEDLFQHMRPSADDFKLFCEQLHQSEEQETKPKKSAILSVIEGHSHRYTPKTVQLDLPAPLTSLYQSSRLVLDLPALLEEGAKVFEELNLTPEQCLLVEEKTRKQSRSRVWFEQRAGRVTASSFHEAAKTESSSWGLQNEDTAKKSYLVAMQDHHEDINVAASGLILNPELPWIGASPDGVVTCACHEPGILEIKCPFSAKDRSLLECTKDSRFCLTVPEGGVMSLKLDHSYMYQVQAQMRVAEVMFCDFVVWTPQELFKQRIMFDGAFFDVAHSKVVNFIRTGILPELLGKWFTVPRFSPTATSDKTSEGH
ncbi:Exonuclease [Dissostichus eleginoides]|uniref:Exonuclease n=1 Tax=Dissostichus eleginoides TaxID=100907 RepID=A0AAD9FBL6_DISEL|nr:Exonuclease [Dissostichus eleginoides]